MATWLTDKNGNKCSIEYWGTKEKAQEALDSLKDCSDCSDCSYCYRCSRCSRCSDCSDCSDCSRCYECSDCSNCSGCTDCYECSDCTNRYSASGNTEKSEAEINVPIIPSIHKAVYEAASQPKALEMGLWHTCENTHCRAGWVITLAGKEGRELEKRFDTLLAAMMIYDASDPTFKINPCRFFDTNEDALEDMKRLAEGGADGTPRP